MGDTAKTGPGKWSHGDDKRVGLALVNTEGSEALAMGNTWCTCVTAKGALAMRPGLERVRERCSETHLSASLFISPGRPEWRLSLENYKKNAAELRLSQLREHLCGLSSSPHGELMEPLLSESTVNHTFHPCLPNSAAAAVFTFTSPFLGLAPHHWGETGQIPQA